MLTEGLADVEVLIVEGVEVNDPVAWDAVCDASLTTEARLGVENTPVVEPVDSSTVVEAILPSKSDKAMIFPILLSTTSFWSSQCLRKILRTVTERCM